jgi:TPR repeat protein
MNMFGRCARRNGRYTLTLGYDTAFFKILTELPDNVQIPVINQSRIMKINLLYLIHRCFIIGMFASVIVSSGAAKAQEMSLQTATKLAKNGNPQAQLVVGKAFENGNLVDKNFVAAAQWYKKAMRKGNVEATFRFARLVHYGGEGLEKSPELAVQLYLRASRQDFPLAQYWLGYAYQYGFGSERDLGKALEWYRRAAQNNVAQAQNNLAMLHLAGEGVEKNPKLAVRFLNRAVKLDYSWAKNNLAGLYELGWGVKKDPARARQLYEEAAAAGNPKARQNLQRINGEPITQGTAVSGDQPSVQIQPLMQDGATKSFDDINKPSDRVRVIVSPPPAE